MDTQLLAIFLLGMLLGFVSIYAVLQRNRRKELERTQERNSDPYRISALELSKKERKALGADAPNPDRILMQVRFEVASDQRSSVSENAREKITQELDGVWRVHANGRLQRTKAAPENVRVISLDDEYCSKAQPYFELAPEERAKSWHAPTVYDGGDLYRLVWHKGEWYLSGADEEYRLTITHIHLRSMFEQAKQVYEQPSTRV